MKWFFSLCVSSCVVVALLVNAVLALQPASDLRSVSEDHPRATPELPLTGHRSSSPALERKP